MKEYNVTTGTYVSSFRKFIIFIYIYKKTATPCWDFSAKPFSALANRLPTFTRVQVLRYVNAYCLFYP